MIKESIIICDYCGNEIKRRQSYLHIGFEDWGGIDSTCRKGKEMCWECYDKVLKMLKGNRKK